MKVYLVLEYSGIELGGTDCRIDSIYLKEYNAYIRAKRLKKQGRIDSVYNALYEENIRHSSIYERGSFFSEEEKKPTNFIKNNGEKDALEQGSNKKDDKSYHVISKTIKDLRRKFVQL